MDSDRMMEVWREIKKSYTMSHLGFPELRGYDLDRAVVVAMSYAYESGLYNANKGIDEKADGHESENIGKIVHDLRNDISVHILSVGSE